MTEASLARLTERIEHIAKGVDELRPLITESAEQSRDISHITSLVQQMTIVQDMHRDAFKEGEVRISKLEVRVKFVMWVGAFVASTSVGIFGYGISFLDSLGKFQSDTDSRIRSVEFIVQSPAFERVMERDGRPVVEGGKD